MDCRSWRNERNGYTEWEARLPPGVSEVITPDGRHLLVRPGIGTMRWMVSDQDLMQREFKRLIEKDTDTVKTHAKVNGGKLMFETRARNTAKGWLFFVLFNNVEVYQDASTYDDAHAAEQAGTRFVSKAVAKLFA